MNNYWSTYVQSTEELYYSRAIKFRPEIMHRWVDAMGIKNGQKLLEVGCAGGVLSHSIKKFLPDTDITGIDFDIGHIEYAEKKTAELGLDCTFLTGDACDLPFDDNVFDVCFSHTVVNFCEPDKFFGEQHRVLKPGGRMIIMCVHNLSSAPEEWVPTEDCEEKTLFDKLWAEAAKNENSNIRFYENRKEKYFEYLRLYGFRDISVDVVSVIKYAPDCDCTSRELALAQINDDRRAELSSAEKARQMASDALTEREYRTLVDMINRRYDKRIKMYVDGEKTYEFRVSTTVLISGTK